MATLIPFPATTGQAAAVDRDELGCWECGASVPAPQRIHSLSTLEAIICGSCEPWVRAMLGKEIEA
jgi:hypothetical protein